MFVEQTLALRGFAKNCVSFSFSLPIELFEITMWPAVEGKKVFGEITGVRESSREGEQQLQYIT